MKRRIPQSPGFYKARWSKGIFLLYLLLLSTSCFTQHFVNHSEVRSEDGKVNLYLNGERIAPFAYMSYLGETAYFHEMADAGVDLFCLLAYMGDEGINSTTGIKPFRPSFWKGRGKYDFTVVEKEFEMLRAAKPDAKAIIRVHLDAPVWWGRENPDELCRLPDGKTLRVSFSSKKWQKDAGEALAALLDWVRNSPFNENLAGIHVAGGFTEEWFFHYREHFYDESPARMTDFRNWLRNKYRNDIQLLRTTWKLPDVTFETASPADISGKMKGRGLRKRGENPALDDTFEYHSMIMPENIVYFARLVKEKSNGRLLTGAFYGYHLFVHDPSRGHGSLGTLLQSPYLDYLSSPNDYRREAGVDWLPLAAIKSVQTHGKLWLAENDTRTSLTTLLREKAPHIAPDHHDAYDKGVWIGPDNLEISKELLWKNAARMLAYGYGGWWFDMWGGWFSDPELMSVIETLNAAYEAYELAYDDENEGLAYSPEVAVVVDEKLQFFDNSFGETTGHILSNRYALGNSGTSFDVFLKSDLAALKKENYRVIWYLGLTELSDGEKVLIDDLKRQTLYSIETHTGGSVLYEKERRAGEFPERVRWRPGELREVYRKAGVHVFSAFDDVVYAGNNWLAVHFEKAGKREILLPEKWLLIDVREGSEPLIANRMEIEGEAGETIFFRVEK